MNVIAFQTKLDGDTIHIDNAANLLGKDVMVTIVEMPIKENLPQKKEWASAGKGKTDIDVDQLNIRDFAYE